jgi:hypothetical protein
VEGLGAARAQRKAEHLKKADYVKKLVVVVTFNLIKDKNDIITINIIKRAIMLKSLSSL